MTFDYPFQYLVGTLNASAPIDLTGYTGSLILTSTNGLTVYSRYNSSASPGTSGVFFGGQSHTPTNGIIDLVIIAADTAAITWPSPASYTFSLTDTHSVVSLVLTGTFGIVGTLPT